MLTLQGVLEAAPAYYRTVTGLPPGPAEAQSTFTALPPDKTYAGFARLGIAPTPLPCAPFEAAVIVCFVIAPSRRRRGIARVLLQGALESFAARGFRLVDAFPFKSSDSQLAADHYHGPLPPFLDAGFSVIGQHRRLTAMRKLLGSPP